MTQLALYVTCGLFAEAAWLWLPYKTLGYVSGLAGAFCMITATAIWSMREKVDVASAETHWDAASFARASMASNVVRRRSMIRAAAVTFSALAAASPLVSSQASQTVWHWMVVAGGLGVAEAIYSFLLANAWEEELRAVRSRRILESKERQERERAVLRIEGSRPIEKVPTRKRRIASRTH